MAISSLFVHRARAYLTVAAVALSVSLVVAVTSGYASLDAAARKFMGQFLGTWDAQITRPTDPGPGVDVGLIDLLEGDPAVRRAVGRLDAELRIQGKSPNPAESQHASVFGIDLSRDDSLSRLRLVKGRWFNDDEPNSAVIDEGTQRATGCDVGDTITVPGTSGKLALKVTGIVHKPGILSGYIRTLYVPLASLQKFIFDGRTDRVSKIQIELFRKSDADGFVERNGPILRAADPLLRLQLTRQQTKELDANLQVIGILSYLGGAVSMLAATFIVFSTISMGVTERQRGLAMLRAVGMVRGQIVRLVLLEGVVLGALGACVGVPLGILWIKLLAWQFEVLFLAGAVVSIGGIAFASLGSVAAALMASLLPALSASRVDPLTAMSAVSQPDAHASRPPLLATVLGFVLITLDPLLLFSPLNISFEREVRFYGHFAVGIPAIMLGFFLLAPLFVWTTDRLLSRTVATLLGVRHALLRQQLSGGLWRAAGTCAALMVGLAVLVVMQTGGHSALSSWQIPDRFPDVFIFTTSRAGLNPKAQEELARLPGIKPGETMPIAMFSPQFGGSVFGIAGAAILPEATMFFGVDPDKAFDMMHLDFRQGNPKDAADMLRKGRHLVITEEFHRLKGLNVGDKFSLLSLTRGKIDFTVAGVVWSPGIDVMVSSFDLGRQFEQRTAASVFGTLDDARTLFGVEHVYLVAANLELSTPKKELIAKLQADLGDKGLDVADVRQLKHEILQTFNRLLLVSSTVAWAAMAVASLGVTNAVMASVRTRRWQFGILRSVGVTRDTLLRLVLSEALLLGVVAVALGLSAGLLMAIDARQSWGQLLGYLPPFSVPWKIVLLGAGIVVAIAIVASLAPALHVARKEPLELLQAGRAST
ncbi:MAG: FtsX-like permease family protein [Tepidisphaeraceae bacterium]